MTVLRLAACAADGSKEVKGKASPAWQVVRRLGVFPLALSFWMVIGQPTAWAGDAKAVVPSPPPAPESRWEVAQETAAMFGLNNPNGYRTLPQILSVRWQPTASEQFFHTPFDMKRQFTFSVVAVPFVKGAENYYFGLGVGVRQVWTKPGSHFSLYIDGRFAVGTTDSTGAPYGQGEDMTFSALVGTGLMYQVNSHVKLGAGFMYEHFSNGGFSEPEVQNIGLDTIGPNFNVSISF